MKDFKSRLLCPVHDALTVTILGSEFFIRRLSAYELAEFEDKAAKLRSEDNTRGLAMAGASLVLNALVSEDGQPIADLPAPDELMKAHSYASLIEALTVVQRHSYGTLEEAKKN
ncbi:MULTISPECIES: phage tail protein [Pantoea]|uniref:Phage tail protein n=1 Tax=Candidatus Pantoea gossypiicola TaxID=2608008 RepID=A0AB34CNR5_9GAMM|nr:MULTISPECIES: phage tail protein [Pantoea]KAA5961004.1 phage tail protein [Pantoea sp. VH_24]KAA5964457.1 phage tail protein [Pantoea sp. VH_16]KAA5968606.1 phage tail protein [Pantoea sp. VH_18]KAA6004326.1 phage tail protein [Pantoea sp. M_1]KAA6006812.1 phage tail protein [Pantoea sp. F_7]